jgi:hypothetical protein
MFAFGVNAEISWTSSKCPLLTIPEVEHPDSGFIAIILRQRDH